MLCVTLGAVGTMQQRVAAVHPATATREISRRLVGSACSCASSEKKGRLHKSRHYCSVVDVYFSLPTVFVGRARAYFSPYFLAVKAEQLRTVVTKTFPVQILS